MKIYTKTGDDGSTGLYGGGRLPKDDARIEAYGTVDELNALIGLARTEPLPAEMDLILNRIQNELFDVGAELATVDAAGRLPHTMGQAEIEALEQAIDWFEPALSPLRQFILPGGTRGAAVLHLARTVCRRAERRVVTLAVLPDQNISGALLVYLNRLGDLLFVLARVANAAADVADVPWARRA
ncbi:MAG: cob(I)yrinic acid a,c-diamide adenosyltransferase [Pirellulales bacterium]